MIISFVLLDSMYFLAVFRLPTFSPGKGRDLMLRGGGGIAVKGLSPKPW